MKEKTKAYVAGIIDAEGCFDVRKQLVRDTVNFAASVIIQTTDRPFSKWLTKHFGGVVRNRIGFGPNKDSFRWEIHNAHHGKQFISLVLPYLILKKAEAALVLAYYDLQGSRVPEQRQVIFESCRALKQSSVTTETPSFPTKQNLINAYFAGFFDGEGSVQLGRSPQNTSGFQYIPRVSLVNTNRMILEKAHKFYGGNFGVDIRGDKPIHKLSFTSKEEIESFLLQMMPYLIIKRERANLLLQTVRINGQNPEKRNRFYERLKDLNFRGKMIQSELHGRP